MSLYARRGSPGGVSPLGPLWQSVNRTARSLRCFLERWGQSFTMFDRTLHLSASWVRAKAHLGPASVGLVAAYISGGHSFDGHRVNNPHRRREIAMTGLSLPPGVAMSPHELWHWVDLKERRKDGEYQMRSRELPRLASHMRCSLPWGLSPQAAKRVTLAFARFLTEELGLGVQFAIHNKPEHDRDHAHFLMTTRSLAPGNFGKKVRELDGIAMRKREAGTAAEVRYTRADGREKTISSTIESMRARWADLLSTELGFVVDHRSFERRGLDLDPVIYVPRAQIEYEKRQAKRGMIGRDWRAERAAQLTRRTMADASSIPHSDEILLRPRRRADAGILSKLTAQHGHGIVSTAPLTSSQQRIVRDAIDNLGRINSIITLGVISRVEEIALARGVKDDTSVGISPSERRARHRRRDGASGRDTVTNSVAGRARLVLETELSMAERGHDNIDEAQTIAARIANEMNRRERRLRDRLQARYGYAVVQSAAAQHELTAFARMLEAYRDKTMKALRERVARHRLEKRNVAMQARLELAALDALPIYNAIVRLQATAQIGRAFGIALDNLRDRQTDDLTSGLTQWLAGGPNLLPANSAPQLNPTILSSNWSRPDSPTAYVKEVAREPRTPLLSPNTPLAASKPIRKTAGQVPLEKPSSGAKIDVPAFVEREEFGLIRPKPASPTVTDGQEKSTPPQSPPASKSVQIRPARRLDQEIE